MFSGGVSLVGDVDRRRIAAVPRGEVDDDRLFEYVLGVRRELMRAVRDRFDLDVPGQALVEGALQLIDHVTVCVSNAAELLDDVWRPVGPFQSRGAEASLNRRGIDDSAQFRPSRRRNEVGLKGASRSFPFEIPLPETSVN